MNTYQKGFVQNRFIGENIMLIHDIMTECEIDNKQGILILVGFEKAFDTLERGCRQGDPVSPYIFVICVEILGIAIRENKRIEGIKLLGYEHKISQYADDTTLITKNCKNNLNRVLDTLKFFHKVSGLKVNIEKTKVVQLGTLGGGRMINLETVKRTNR